MDNPQYKILIVDDEPDIVEFLSYNLKKEGYEIFCALGGFDAIELAKKHKPHLILLDIMMPGMDGIETCELLRATPGLDQIVIAFLTARGEDYSQVAGFEAGADDYITKPIKPRVLVSRIKALLKRYGKVLHSLEKSEDVRLITRGNLVIDKDRYVVAINNKEIVLPKKEFKLLLLISSKPGKVFNRDEIFSQVWGDDVIVGDRTIDVHIRKLREKIGDDHIVTIKGVGYKFVE